MKKRFIFISIVVVVVAIGYFSLLSLYHNESGSTGSTIKIGAVLPLTGKMAKYGKTSKAALESMLKIININRQDKNELLLEIIYEDNECKSQSGLNATKKLVEYNDVSIIIGAFASSISFPMAKYCEKNKIIMISPGTSASKFSYEGDFIFRTVLSDSIEAEKAANLYNKYYYNDNLAVLFINNAYGDNLKNEFLSNIKNNKIKPLILGYDDNTRDFRTFLTKIKNAQIKTVYLIGYQEMINIFHQANELGLQVNWIGTNQLNDQSLIDKIGSSVENTIFPAWKFNSDSVRINYPQFYKNYLSLSNGLDIDVFAANAVDALLIINSVLHKKKLNTDEIISKLYTIKDFNGLTGTFSFNKNGDVNKQIIIRKIINGKIVTFF